MAELAGNYENGWTWLEMARMTGNDWKGLEMARNGWNGWTWLEIAGHGLKWNGFITVLGIWGVWDMKILGLEDFQLGPAQPGLLDPLTKHSTLHI